MKRYAETQERTEPAYRTSLCCNGGPLEGTDIERAYDGTYMGICGWCKDHAQFVTDEEAEEL